MKLLIGVIVAPRPVETVCKTLESLVNAGFHDPLICFLEPGNYVSSIKSAVYRPRTVSTEGPLSDIKPSPEGKLGNFQNFVQSLRDLIELDSDVDAIMLVEDDAIFAKNVRPLIEKEIDSGFSGVLSLYTPNVRGFFDKEEKGFRTIIREYFFGGLALVITMDIAKKIAYGTSVLNWPGGRKQPSGIQPWEREASDAWVGKAVRQAGGVLKGWNPSMVFHYSPNHMETGNSARELGKANTGPRQAKRFIGVDTDAFEYFNS